MIHTTELRAWLLKEAKNESEDAALPRSGVTNVNRNGIFNDECTVFVESIARQS